MKRVISYLEAYKKIRKPSIKKSFAFKMKGTYTRKVKHKQSYEKSY